MTLPIETRLNAPLIVTFHVDVLWVTLKQLLRKQNLLAHGRALALLAKATAFLG